MAVFFTLLTRDCSLDLLRLAVYLQQDPVALSRGGSGASPRPSQDKKADPAARPAAGAPTGGQGSVLKVTDRHVALSACQVHCWVAQ